MDYRKALEQAIIYIESHLSDDVKVEDVAHAAGYSYYHLNRQFISVLGEGLGSYIKKRRLSEASKNLLYTDKKIIEIAMDSGFESSEAFSRAFKMLYHVNPQTYRKNRLDILLSSKQRLDTAMLDHIVQNVTVHPNIVELTEIKVAGLRGDTTLRDNKLRELWEKANKAVSHIPNKILNGRAFGICEACLNNTLYTMNDDVLFSEVVGIEVSSFDNLPEPFVSKTISSGRYAVFTHKGSLHMLPQTFHYIWGTWFLSTKEEMDDREDFELYDERFLGYNHPDSCIDLYIPIK